MYRRHKSRWCLLILFILVLGGTALAVSGLFEAPVDNPVETVDNYLSVQSPIPYSTPPTVTEVTEETVFQEDSVSDTTSIEEVTEEPHTSYYTYTEEELDLLSRLIEAEGGIESYDTKLKIGSVVMNRVTDTKYFPNTLYEVIYQKNQFSVTFTKIQGVVMIDRPASEDSKIAALEILEYGSVLPPDVEVFYEKSITGGWVGSRAKYGTFDHTTFAYVYSAE